MYRFSAVLLAVALAVAPSFVSNQALAADEPPAVEALIQRGIQLRRTGDDEAALAVFLQAESEAPTSVRVLLHVVTAAQAAGKWLMADEYMRRVSRDKEDAYYRRHRTAIEQVEAAIAQRVGQFQALGAPEGAEVKLNGEVIGTLPMVEPRSFETGTYVMEVTNAGYYNLRRPVSITGGVLTREAIELKQRPADAPLDLTASGRFQGQMAADEAPREWWQSSAITWTLAGVAVLGGAATGAALVVRERQADKWNDDEQCLDLGNPGVTREQACQSVRDDIDLAERVALVGGITAVAFGGAALAHWIVATPSSSERPSATRARSRRVGVACSPGLGSIVCQGAF